MKKIWKVTLWAIALLSTLLVLWGCGGDKPEETPDEGTHTCAGVSWVTEKEATCTVEGSKKFVCSCGKTVKTEKIPLGNHNLVDGVCTVCGYSCIEIRTVEDLKNVVSNLSGNYILMNDLDLGGMKWTPIGTSDSPFLGTFDGNDHVISNFKITGVRSYAGLFGRSEGAIKNLEVNRFSIDVDNDSISYASIDAGGLVGRNYYGTITNCCAIGMVMCSTSGSYASIEAGGLVGRNYYGTITNCYATGDVSGTSDGDYSSHCIGGLVGLNSDGTITNSYATGDIGNISSNSGACAGGLVGGNFGTITNCYATGGVSSISTNFGANAGGLVGSNTYGTITNSYAMGDVSSTSARDAYAGGLVGNGFGSAITNCYALGNISSTSTVSRSYAGGLVGQDDHETIINSYRYSGQSFTVTEKGTTAYFSTNTEGMATSVENLKSKVWVERNLWKAEIEIWNFDVGYPTLNYEAVNALMQSEIEISTKEDLLKLQGGGLFGNYKLMADIDLCGMEWQPIALLLGAFDGNGHTISNFKITGDIQYAGLFGYNKGTIENFGLESFTIDVSRSGDIYVGGLVGDNDGTILNCYTTGDVSSVGAAMTGGLVGCNTYGTITNCYAAGDVSSTSSVFSAYVGGLVGYNNEGTITNCYATGDVSGSSSGDTNYVGGLVGYDRNGTITNCYAMGDISSNSGACAGGLVGHTYANEDATASTIIINSYATGDVSGSGSSVYAGGLVGENYGTITNCYATGEVSASSTSARSSAFAYAGGLVGENYGTITNCYATGAVSASASGNYAYAYAYAGGLVGENNGTITNCYRYSGQSFTVTVNGTTKHSATNTEGTATDMETLQSVDFQKNTLLWSAEDWNFAEGAHPTLKNVGLTN